MLVQVEVGSDLLGTDLNSNLIKSRKSTSFQCYSNVGTEYGHTQKLFRQGQLWKLRNVIT